MRTEESLRTHPALAELPSLDAHYPNDPGILVSLMLNLVQLAPGQAIYLAAGNVHAYLRGLGVEVMANSDNVLRGGLTAKHIDLPELLRITVFEPQDVPLLHPRTTDFGQQVFAPPFDEFQLQHIELPAAEDAADMADADVPIAANGPVLMICVDGQLVVDTPRGDQVTAPRRIPVHRCRRGPGHGPALRGTRAHAPSRSRSRQCASLRRRPHSRH